MIARDALWAMLCSRNSATSPASRNADSENNLAKKPRLSKIGSGRTTNAPASEVGSKITIREDFRFTGRREFDGQVRGMIRLFSTCDAGCS